MGVFFQCPSCSHKLFYESGDQSFQVCRHCKGNIIVPSTVIHENDVRELTAPGQSVETQRNLRVAELQSELNAGRKINAIRLFQESFGGDLTTAKNAVEILQAGGRIPGQALTTLSPEKPVEQRIYTNTPEKPESSVKTGPLIFWIILSIGIAVAAIFWGE